MTADTTPARRLLRQRLEREAPVFAPVCLEPLQGRMIDELGYGAAYLSGGGLGYAYAVSEALLTLTEVADAARRITQRCAAPLIVDGGVGFGDAVHAARAIWELEAAGAAAVELEDQVAPKRVSHHRGVEHLIPLEEMTAKIAAAAAARTDPGFLIIARTGAVRHEGWEQAIARARAYRAAGADLLMLFPQTEEQWRAAPELLDGAPLAAMASFSTHTKAEWAALGWRLVIDPFTGQVLAYDAMRESYRRYLEEDSTGRPAREVWKIYETLQRVAGLEPLYDLERATTEPGT
ncbi:MAG: oxaloacetate decarboxylase [Acidimicrobiales bacterium]